MKMDVQWKQSQKIFRVDLFANLKAPVKKVYQQSGPSKNRRANKYSVLVHNNRFVQMSTSRSSQQGGLNETTSWRILWKDLALCTYKYK